MGWTSQDDMINDMTVNGQADSHIYQKTLVAAGTAGHWQQLLTSAGNIPAATFGAADLTYTETTNAWSEGALPIDDQTSPITKHLTAAGASLTAAAGAPWFVQLIDLHGYAKLSTTNVSTTGTKTITMTAIASGASTYDRYPLGAGLRIAVAAIATMGANAPTMVVNYLNTAGAAKATVSGCVSTASATNGTILNSGNAANKYGPFLPLAAGDTGVSDLVSLVWGGTAHASGSVAVLLCKPIGMPIPIPATGLFNVFDYANTLPSFPQLRNGANLTALVYNTGATTSGGTFFMSLDYGWGGKMGLLGNGFRHNQTGKLFGGTNLDGANPSVHEYRGHMTARMRNQFAGEGITDPVASVPSGARPPVAWVMARRNGAISSRNAAVISLGASGAGSMGVAASGLTTITFDLTGMGGLISSASGTAGFTLDAAGNVFATKSTSGTAGFALGASGTLFASGSLGGSAGVTFGASWTPYAVGWLSGSTADSTVLTVDAIAAGVLAAALTTPIYSDVRKVNAVTVTGNGQPGTEWGP